MMKSIITILIIIIVLLIYKIYMIKQREKDKKNERKDVEELVYPKHIAFIMDGNGRWAKEQNKERTFGHLNGGNNLPEIFYNCFNNGSQYLTFYAFSEQNWKRSPEEIRNIFDIIY